MVAYSGKNFIRGRKVINYSVYQRLYANIAAGCAGKHRHNLAVKHCFTKFFTDKRSV
jgi:hypothetical protein